MKNRIFLATVLMALPLMADVRVRLQIGAGHPIHRPGRMVVVRPMRPAIRPLGPSVVYAPPVIWNRSVVALPVVIVSAAKTAKPLPVAKAGSIRLST